MFSGRGGGSGDRRLGHSPHGVPDCVTAALTVPGFGCAIAAGHRDALDSECGKALDRVRFPAPWGFAAKFLFTAVTLGSGFKGVR